MRIIYGVGIDRMPGNGFRRVSVLLFIGGLVLAALALNFGKVLFISAIIIAFCTAWAWPGLLTYTVVSSNPNRPAAATGISQAGIMLGSGITPVFFGILAENYGYSAVWGTTALIVIAGSIIMWNLARKIQG